MDQKVTVIGTGRMGSALASALFKKGFNTTVWNRTAAKTEALSQLGLRVAHSVVEAVKEAQVVIVSLRDYNSTLQLLQHPEIEPRLHGKILVQLSSGTPMEARAMQSWTQRCGIRYLDGAIWSFPIGIGTPACLILYSGPEEYFNCSKQVLRAFGENAVWVGPEIGQAPALDYAVAGAFVPYSMFGFLQGYVLCEAENIPPAMYMQFVKDSMSILDGYLGGLFEKIQNKDYAGDQGTLEAWYNAPRGLISCGKEHGTDHSIADAQLSLMDRAIKSGNGQADFAYLYEVLKKSSG
jgi:3-hydroxyisobutyrate dehydrogenase-like beta-hydroxyacid dehydrogenase